jgi:hypothetical protein
MAKTYSLNLALNRIASVEEMKLLISGRKNAL